MSPTPIRCAEAACYWQSRPGLSATSTAAAWYTHWCDTHGVPVPPVDCPSDLAPIHGSFHDVDEGGEQ